MTLSSKLQCEMFSASLVFLSAHVILHDTAVVTSASFITLEKDGCVHCTVGYSELCVWCSRSFECFRATETVSVYQKAFLSILFFKSGWHVQFLLHGQLVFAVCQKRFHEHSLSNVRLLRNYCALNMLLTCQYHKYFSIRHTNLVFF